MHDGMMKATNSQKALECFKAAIQPRKLDRFISFAALPIVVVVIRFDHIWQGCNDP